MAFPLQITCKNMDRSPALEQGIRDRVDRLLHPADRAIDCHVVVDVQHRRSGAGRHFHVGIDLALPGARIAAGSHADGEHADIQEALGSAFAAAQRQLDDLRDQRRAHRPGQPAVQAAGEGS